MDKPKIRPDCFGRWWEAVSGSAGNNCRPCGIKDDCLVEFATTTLPAAREYLGPAGALSALAEHLEVAEPAVLVAMAYDPNEVDVTAPSRPRQTPVLKPEPDPGEKPKKKVGRKRKAKKKDRKKNAGWGVHTHEARWNRERERNPLIAQLTPGMQLRAKFKGKDIVAMVKKGGYSHRESTFPTLSTLTTHIVGGNRNASKFWGLKEEG